MESRLVIGCTKDEDREARLDSSSSSSSEPRALITSSSSRMEEAGRAEDDGGMGCGRAQVSTSRPCWCGDGMVSRDKEALWGVAPEVDSSGLEGSKEGGPSVPGKGVWPFVLDRKRVL